MGKCTSWHLFSYGGFTNLSSVKMHPKHCFLPIVFCIWTMLTRHLNLKDLCESGPTTINSLPGILWKGTNTDCCSLIQSKMKDMLYIIPRIYCKIQVKQNKHYTFRNLTNSDSMCWLKKDSTPIKHSPQSQRQLKENLHWGGTEMSPHMYPYPVEQGNSNSVKVIPHICIAHLYCA